MRWIKLVWVLLFLVPFIATVYIIFPYESELTFLGQTYHLNYYDSWMTFVWMLSLLVVPAIISIVLILILPKRSTPWPVIAVLAEMLFLMVWNIERMVAASEYINGHSYLITALISSTVVLIGLLIRYAKRPTEREKKEELLRAIDLLTDEDLPALFCSFLDIEMSAAEAKEKNLVTNWKEIFVRDVERGKFITTAALEKFLEVKDANK